MTNHSFRTALLCLLAVAFDVSAQTVTDNFSTAANWSAATNSGSATLAISGGRLNYTSTGVASDSGSHITWTAGTLSYTSNWEVQADVHARAASGGSPFNYFYASLGVFKTGDSLFTNIFDQPLYNSMTADIMRPGGAANGFQLSYTRASDNFYELPSNGGLGIPNNTTDAALRVTFDASTKVLTAWFDDDGATGGYSWTSAASIDTDGAENLNMTGSDTFTPVFSFASGTDVFVGGDVYFDNFSLTAIPEPSTHAAIVGTVVLVGTILRRRRRIATGG